MTNPEKIERAAGRADEATGQTRGFRTNKVRTHLTRALLGALIGIPVLAAASGALSQSSSFRWDEVRATLLETGIAAPARQRDDTDDPVSALADFMRALPPASVDAQDGTAGDRSGAPGHGRAHFALLGHAQPADAEATGLTGTELPEGHPPVARDSVFAALAEFAREIEGGRSSEEASEPTLRLAEAKSETKKSKPVKAVVKVAGEEEATFVGSQACLKCHTTQAAVFGQTIMGRIFRNPRTPQEKGGCETCHGAGSLHVKAGGGRGVGGIISFRKDDHSRTVAENNAICLACHDRGQRVNWDGSTHQTRDVACTNCHTVMANVSPKSQLKTVYEIDTCFQCHKNKRAEIWRSSHMPVREGKMTCSSCHNPHGSFSESLLKEATTNDVCYKCHAEKRGPFLWEHAPVRENCTNCHDPHGSTNEFLLKVSRPRLCQQCHSGLTGHPSNPRNPVSVFAINRECQNCHSQHHGSNSPSGVRFQR